MALFSDFARVVRAADDAEFAIAVAVALIAGALALWGRIPLSRA